MLAEFIRVILTYNFMGRAFIVAVLIGVVAGIIGAFVILRGLSLMGDAIGHAVLPGVALSHLTGIPHVVGAAVFGLLASMLIGFLGEKTELKKDTIMGAVFSSFFAFGIIMVSQIRTMTDLNSILFGNILSVQLADVWNMVFVAIGLVLFVVLLYKELLLTSFDETVAKVYGFKTSLIHYAFLFILTIIIVLSLQIVGAILIVAMIIIPAATAYLLTNRMHIMIFLSALFGVVSSIVGMFLSISFNYPSGASIVVSCAVLFAIALLLAPKKGLIAQRVNK